MLQSTRHKFVIPLPSNDDQLDPRYVEFDLTAPVWYGPALRCYVDFRNQGRGKIHGDVIAFHRTKLNGEAVRAPVYAARILLQGQNTVIIGSPAGKVSLCRVDPNHPFPAVRSFRDYLDFSDTVIGGVGFFSEDADLPSEVRAYFHSPYVGFLTNHGAESPFLSIGAESAAAAATLLNVHMNDVSQTGHILEWSTGHRFDARTLALSQQPA